MSDIKLLKDQIKALEVAGKQLRANEKVFHKALGLDEQIQKANEDLVKLENNIETSRDRLRDLRNDKNDAIKPALLAIQAKMNEILPDGDGVVHIEDDGSLTIGWLKGFLRPYSGLSGGEKVMFNAALSFALLGQAPNKVLILEGAELDQGNLKEQMAHIEKTNPDAQIIINTCNVTDIGYLSDEWNIVKIEGD